MGLNPGVFRWEKLKTFVKEAPLNARILYGFLKSREKRDEARTRARFSLDFPNDAFDQCQILEETTEETLKKIASSGQDDESLSKNLSSLILLLEKEGGRAKGSAIRRDATGLLLHFREKKGSSAGSLPRIQECLNYLGVADPPLASKGIRILSIDGGGMRGVVGLEVLRALEEITGKHIHDLFDFICGVSTGAIIASLLGFQKKSLEEVEKAYKTIGVQVFTQNVLNGAKGYLLNHSYYNTSLYEDALKGLVGETRTWDAVRDFGAPKVALVSSIVSETRMAPFVFRNYVFPKGVTSNYKGSHEYPIWAAVRASSAAPGYFDEVKLQDAIHHDGGILTNNPSQIAIHEAKKIWPKRDIQCVVSLGLGRYDPITFNPKSPKSLSLAQKFARIVDSATDTEIVHETLHDLLPGHVYYRFNPYLSEYISLDETKPAKINLVKEESRMYIRRNYNKIMDSCLQLNKSGTWWNITRDIFIKRWKIMRARYRYLFLLYGNNYGKNSDMPRSS